MELTPAQRLFVLHWGEMGTQWGINRTVAQIHALLYISPRPLNAEDITETLSVARSNVSNSLRELQSWRVVRTVHELGDRRDYFESIGDVWDMFQVILDERKRRELDPTLLLLHQCIDEAKKSTPDDKHTLKRLKDLLGFFDTIDNWYRQMRCLPTRSLVKFLGMGAAMKKLLKL